MPVELVWVATDQLLAAGLDPWWTGVPLWIGDPAWEGGQPGAHHLRPQGRARLAGRRRHGPLRGHRFPVRASLDFRGRHRSSSAWPGNHPIRTSADLVKTIEAGAPGGTVRITVHRVGPDGEHF